MLTINNIQQLHIKAPVGYVASGGYAHWTHKSMALGYVPAALAKEGTTLEVEILGDRYPARVITQSLYDSTGQRMRS